ncbi:hypothetical protein [Glaciecola sp. MF2-115]|uniref:hypothetical protein n=1 Tax=Glaciecola sp. MF2-115 TaxID=3384827 RepID=UPI0039A0EF7D
MITQNKNPLEWSTLMYELDDAVEHLNALVTQMSENGEIDEIEYKIQIAHVYAHLNRSWNTRNLTQTWNPEDREKLTQMPDDLEPVG